MVFDYLSKEGDGFGYACSENGLQWGMAQLVTVPGGARMCCRSSCSSFSFVIYIHSFMTLMHMTLFLYFSSQLDSYPFFDPMYRLALFFFI